MHVTRDAAHAPRTQVLVAQVATLKGPCVGCPGCTGLCRELIELMTVPEAVLK